MWLTCAGRINPLTCDSTSNHMLTGWSRMLAGSRKNWCILPRLLHIPVFMAHKMLRRLLRTGECRGISHVGKQARSVSNLGLRWHFCRHFAGCSGGSDGFDDATRRGFDFNFLVRGDNFFTFVFFDISKPETYVNMCVQMFKLCMYLSVAYLW